MFEVVLSEVFLEPRLRDRKEFIMQTLIMRCIVGVLRLHRIVRVDPQVSAALLEVLWPWIPTTELAKCTLFPPKIFVLWVLQVPP